MPICSGAIAMGVSSPVSCRAGARCACPWLPPAPPDLLRPQYLVVRPPGDARCGVNYNTEIPCVSTANFCFQVQHRPRRRTRASAGGGATLRGGRLLELDGLPLEVGGVVEALVDRGEAQVGHVVEHPEA